MRILAAFFAAIILSFAAPAGAQQICGNGSTPVGKHVNGVKDAGHVVTSAGILMVTSSPDNVTSPLGWVYGTKGAGYYVSTGGTAVPVNSGSSTDALHGYKASLKANGKPVPLAGPGYQALKGN